jgi:hypothetical protein
VKNAIHLSRPNPLALDIQPLLAAPRVAGPVAGRIVLLVFPIDVGSGLVQAPLN